MRALLSLLLLGLVAGCEHKRNYMNSSNLPENWTSGDLVPETEIYSDPPASSDILRVEFYGLLDGDPGHRLYSVPAGTPVAQVVRVFAVGSHSEISYGDDAAETIEIVAAKATKIGEIIPCHIVFADAAGLKLRFERQVTDDDIRKIEALFPLDEMMQSGLERYLSEWDGEGSVLAPVKEENLFHFWWD